MTTVLPDREGDSSYKAPRAQLNLSQFDLLRRLGDGSLAQVVHALHRSSGKEYAIKIVDKHLVVRHKQTEYVKQERNILDHLSHPGIVKLHFTFQDAGSLYFGLDLCSNGELFDQIQRRGKLSLEAAQFYAAEVVLILEYLRKEQVIHRDVKPENLLLSDTGHLKLIDFGSAKPLYLPAPVSEAEPEAEEGVKGKAKRAVSLVGTADYVAPEMLNNTPTGYAADLWSLGCTIFQMLAGRPPFKGVSEYLTFQNITARAFSFPDDFPENARDLVDKLLVLEPSERLGAGEGGFEEIKAHPFFQGIEWEGLFESTPPQFLPPPAGCSSDDETPGLDWELSSLAAAMPVEYSYNMTEGRNSRENNDANMLMAGAMLGQQSRLDSAVEGGPASFAGESGGAEA